MARVTTAASAELDRRLQQMIAAAPAGISVTSEVRDAKRQQQLWDAAVKKYGSAAEARKWVAPPGHSQHEVGHAADLAFATPAARKWAHDNAARFGLSFPLGNEPWHIEVAGARATAGAAPVAGTTAKPMTDQQIRDYVISHYGYAASYLHDPEIGPILLDAAKRGLGGDELRGKLSNTRWWKTHSDSQVTWDNLNEQNPAEARAKVEAAKATIGADAKQKGIVLSDLQVHDLAVLSLRNNWNADQLNNAMSYQAKMDPAKKTTAVTGLRESASAYMVQLSDPVLDKWATDIALGSVTRDDFTTYLKEQAKIMRPWASKQIDAGLTTSQVVDPYRNLIASTLEMDPNRVDFTLPKFSAILDGMSDKTTGQNGPMSLSQAGAYLRGLDDYKGTASAINQGAEFATQLVKTLGKVA